MADPTVWESSSTPALVTSPSFYQQKYTLLADGQTVFVLTLFTYTPGSKKIMVFCNGVYQTDFTETDATTITLNFATLLTGDVVDIIGFV